MPKSNYSSDEKKKKKEEAPTAHELRMYNQYARHAISRGDENVEDQATWIAKRRKKEGMR